MNIMWLSGLSYTLEEADLDSLSVPVAFPEPRHKMAGAIP